MPRSPRPHSTDTARWALASLALSMLLATLGISIANVALPTLARAFGGSFQQVQWVVLAYLLGSTTAIVGAGRLADLAGRRRLLLAGLALFTSASLLCGVAPTLGLLIAARAAQGLGAAVLMALPMAFVADTVPASRIGGAMGLLGTTSAVGTALGPSLGGLLIGAFGWRAVFLVGIPLGLAAFLLGARFLPAEPARTVERGRLDAAGTVLLAATLAAYALAMTAGRGRFGPRSAALLGAACVGGGLFALVERGAPAPLVRLAMFRDPVLRAGFTTSLLVTTVVMATLVVGPFYLSGALALDAARVGLVLSAGPIVAALTGVPAGRLVDRFGTPGMTRTGLAAMAVGAGALALLPSRFGVPGYVAPLVVLTAGYALFQAANNTAVMSAAAADQKGVASGLLNLSRNLGLITGTAAMGAVFALGAGTHDAALARPEAVAAGMRTTFAAAAVLIAVALAVASAGSRTRRSAARPKPGLASGEP